MDKMEIMSLIGAWRKKKGTYKKEPAFCSFLIGDFLNEYY